MAKERKKELKEQYLPKPLQNIKCVILDKLLNLCASVTVYVKQK